MDIGILALFAALILTLYLLVRICVFFLRKVKRFSLRGLLLAIAVVAILLSGVLGYRRASMAQIKWLDPSSKAAKAMFPSPAIREREDGACEFHYYAKNRNIQKLLPEVSSGGYSVGEEEITIFTRHEGRKSEAKKQLEAIRAADVLPQGSFVIRGLVRDSGGDPVPRAQIDILGKFVFINCWRTREDGTFTMALTDENAGVRDGGGYYFRIRHLAETKENLIRWHSRYFKLHPQNPEMVVDIVLP